MSVNQLIRAFIPDFFDKILPDTNANVRDALVSWMFGDNASELEEGSVEHLLSICSNSPAFIKVLDKARSGENISDQEILSLIVEDSITFSEMIKAYLKIVSKGEVLSFDDETMQAMVDKVEDIIVKKFGKDYDLYDDGVQDYWWSELEGIALDYGMNYYNDYDEDVED